MSKTRKKKEVGKVVKKKKARAITLKLRRLDIIVISVVIVLIIAGIYMAFYRVPTVSTPTAKEIPDPFELLKKNAESLFTQNLTNATLLIRYRVRGAYTLNTPVTISDTVYVTVVRDRNTSRLHTYYETTPYMSAILSKLGIRFFEENNTLSPPRISNPEEILINIEGLKRENIPYTYSYVGEEEITVTLSTINMTSPTLERLKTVTNVRTTQVYKYFISDVGNTATLTLWVDKETRVPLKAVLMSSSGELTFVLTDVAYI
ncbi:MAG: hypothetical protein QN229_06025 [Desulfurococcaceae archaeon TW002]